jgi:hypothetical protein
MFVSMRRPAGSRYWLTAVTVLFLVAQTVPVRAWGEKGHRIAGAVADTRLTPAAKAAIKELLEDDDSLHEKTLAGISNWADQVGRLKFRNSGPWHFVNVPITAATYKDEFCDSSRGCVISKIKEFKTLLADSHAEKAKRREALLFFVHFMEDLHQPLHVGDNNDRGGNQLQVRFVGSRRGTNLHKVWDVNVIEFADLSEASWVSQLNDLANEHENQSWTEGTPIDWANESLKFAKQAYHLPGSGEDINPGEKLDEAYADFALSIIQRRLAQAGVRLANELNEVFGQ